MSSSEDFSFTIDEGFSLQYMNVYKVLPGAAKCVVDVAADVDVVMAVNGEGNLLLGGDSIVLSVGDPIRVPRPAVYELESGATRPFDVHVYGLRAEV